MELPLREGGTQMLGPRMGVHDGDCLACRHLPSVLLARLLFCAGGKAIIRTLWNDSCSDPPGFSVVLGACCACALPVE